MLVTCRDAIASKKNILEEFLEVQKLDMSTPPVGISSCLFFTPAAERFR